LSALFKDATPRAEDNLAIYSRKALSLDDILYLSAQQMKFFRPSVSGVPSSGSASVHFVQSVKLFSDTLCTIYCFVLTCVQFAARSY